MHKAKIRFLIILYFLLSPIFLTAQTINGVINTYAKVTAISGNQFTIGTPGGKSGASLNDYNVGKRVMIYQVKGISINTSNNGAYGAPINYNNSGRYELATVTARNGNVVTVTTPSNSYDVSGMVQLISVPQYTDVTNNDVLSATNWNKTLGYGGVIALEANRLTLGGHIRADGAGFVGGAASSNNGDGCATVYTSNNSKYGAKGESNSTNTQYTRGMSAIGLGGGGGSTHNGGGGGGSNHGYGDDGGRGWSCTSSNNAGGRGGHAYAYNSGNQRLFFGGGGGGGQVNNSYNAKGGNGGGIVFLHVNTLRSGNFHYDISANGTAPPYSIANDGAGGGGAGGIVYVSAKNYEFQSGQIVLEADGADGGDVNTGNVHGGGGGGGSGIVITAVQPPYGVYYSAQNGDAGMDSYTAQPSGYVGYDPPLSQDLLVQTDSYVPAMKGPGGHVPGLSAWFIAGSDDVYTGSALSGTVSDGSGIQSWKNLANSSNYIKTTTGGSTSASFQNDAASLINYNPVVRMSSVNRSLRTVSDIKGRTIIVVTKPTSLSHLSGLVGFDNDKGIRSNSSRNAWSGDGNSDDWNSGGSSHINGVSTKTHNNKWHIVTQKRGSSYTDQFFAGGYRNNRTYSGDIAEIVVYNDALSSTEQRKVESYLAIKYGITLNAADYLASDGTVIWDQSVLANYGNDRAGIGRDDASNLNQTKSKSINSDALLTVEAMSAFDDKEFIVWGNDNSSLTGRSTNVSNEYTERIARVWRVDLTGSTPGLTIKLPLAPLGITNATNEGDYTLITSDDTDFSDLFYYRTGTLNSTRDTVTFSNVYFADNEYFTFTTQALSVPGGNSQYMEFLLTAGSGTGTTTDGAQITTWSDQVNSNDGIVKSGISGPLYRTNGINFNPAVDFTTTNRALRIEDASNINTTSVIYARTVTIGFKTGSDVNSRQVLYEQGGTTRGFNIYIADGMLYVGGWNTGNDGSGSPWSFKGAGAAINTDQAYVMTFQFGGAGSILGVMELHLDGIQRATISNVGLLYAHSSDIGVGAMIGESRFESPVDDETGDGYYFKGHIGDLVYFDTGIGTNTQGMTESSLAIKYGITLNQTPAVDYYSSEYDVIWDGSANTTYNNDIAAIGRDDNSLVNQIKSKSTNSSAVLTIANGTNFSSPSSISSDMNFMFWAHNGSSSTSKTGDYYGLTDSGSARIWKITEEGSIGTVRLQIPKASLPSDVSMILVGTDSTFPNTNATNTATLVSSGDNWEVSYNFSDGQYFTFGRSNTAPVLSDLESADISHCDNNSTLTSAISLADTDNDQVTATVSIGTGYIATEDSLAYSTVAGVTVSSHTKQQIQLSSATLANMQTALRAIQYYNMDSGTDRTTGSRTINFIINDGWTNSNQLSRDIQVYPNPSPVGIYHDD